MDNFLKALTRKKVYGVAASISVVLILAYAVCEDYRDTIFMVFFNPIWPIFLGLIEILLQENEKDIASDNAKKLKALGGVIRGRIENKTEEALISAVIDAVGDTDLMSINTDLLRNRAIQAKVAATEVTQEKVENLNP